MQKETVINVTNLSKAYRLYNSPTDRVKETFSPFRRSYHHLYYALNNVSLEIYRGETVGIIGRNGCGKSTLLQLICGILQPSAGTVQINGRISALLELGAGFNAEFTGRQNVYLNGSILGLSTQQVDEHMDNILSFADIGEYIDQPVKCYSSGMYVRLAFAVAISIEPDILVVDEALSVGDEAFQRKCFAHIHKIQEAGKTILFVSHSAESIIDLCNRAILFDHGEMLLAGNPKSVVHRYQKMLYCSPENAAALREQWQRREDRYHLVDEAINGGEEGKVADEPSAEVISQKVSEEIQPGAAESGSAGNAGKEQTESSLKGETLEAELLGQNAPPRSYDPHLIPESTVAYERKGAVIEDAFLCDVNGNRVNVLTSGEKYFYCYSVAFERSAGNVKFGMAIKTIKGQALCGSAGGPQGQVAAKENFIAAGSRYRVRFPFECRLNPGVYFLNAGVLGRINNEETFLDRLLDVAMFKINEKKNDYSTSIVDLVGFPEFEYVTEYS